MPLEKIPFKISSLQHIALRGGAWAVAAQVFRLACQMASITVLARLLSPGDFGIVGFLGSLTVILALLRDMGLSPAIIRSENISNEELNTLLLVSIGIGGVLFVLVSLLGLILASFVAEPRIAGIAPFYGLIFFIDALGVIPLALMRREMRFREIAIRDTMSNLLGILVGITAAFQGMGYWSLVLMAGASSFTACLLSWRASRWLPQRVFVPFSRIKQLVLFGGSFTGGELANIISQNLDSFLIGRLCGMTELGYYTRANLLIQTPINALLGPVQTVLFPIMSKASHDSANYRGSILFWGKSIVFVFAIGAALAAASSEPIISLVLGNGWSTSAVVFKWLTLLLFARPLLSMVYLIMITTGNMKLFYAWAWTNMLLTLLAITIGVAWGPEGVAASLGLSGLIVGVPLGLWFLSLVSDFKFTTFLWPYIAASLIALLWWRVLIFSMEYLEALSFSDISQLVVSSSLSLGIIIGMASISIKYGTSAKSVG
jgi:O-antigen/teichoic acid export membrane protein